MIGGILILLIQLKIKANTPRLEIKFDEALWQL